MKIRELTNFERFCLECEVPGGCRPSDKRCLQKAARANGVQPEPRQQMNETREGILDLLLCGPFFVHQIKWCLGKPNSSVGAELSELLKDGKVIRWGFGKLAIYELAENV